MNLSMPAAHPACEPAPPTHQADSRRFTLDGSPELEARLARTCAQILAGLRGLLPVEKLEAVLLGGGYGRGEGGVLITADGDRPYNDLEFYVCLRGNRHLNELRHRRPLEVLGQILTPQAGVEVEFKIASLDEFTRSPISMFSYDLVAGHRLLLGRDGLLDGCAHHAVVGKIPLSEATRLLMNRCSGLLFARERLERPGLFTAEDADFVRRNIAKAQLAFGDAVLTAHGRYHWSCRERWRRLQLLASVQAPPWLASVRHHHTVGVDFKLHPERCTYSRARLAGLHAEVTELGLAVWLWIESRRLDAVFLSAGDYVDNPMDKCPETTGVRNLLVNLKVQDHGLGWIKDRPFRHPREKILHALCMLLWEPSLLDSYIWRERLHTELRTKAADLPGLVSAYRSLWAQIN